MKKNVLSFLLIISSYHMGLALNCSIDIAQFMSNNKPYVDVELRILGGSLNTDSLTTDGKLKTLVEVYFKQGEIIKGFEKYELSATYSGSPVDFLDRRRFFLAAGIYSVEILVTDRASVTNKFQYKSNFEVKPSQKQSNPLVLMELKSQNEESPLVRNGLYMESLPFLMVPEDLKQISMYHEVYRNRFLQKKLVLKTTISRVDSNSLIQQPLVKYNRIGDKEVEVIVNKFDVSGLTSGYYDILVEVLDADKTVLDGEKIQIIVENTLADATAMRNFDELFGNTFVEEMDSTAIHYSLMAIVPITNYKMMGTIDQIIRKGDLNAKKFYLWNHWNEAHPGIAKVAHDKYMKVARVVDEMFYSNVGRGFQTDRGYIYLKYGKPNKTIQVLDEPNTPPYEIWYYDFLDRTMQTNVRFLFFDPFLVNNFELLHSTCRSERSNPAWETVLYKYNQDEIIGERVIATEVQENWGRRAKELFNDF